MASRLLAFSRSRQVGRLGRQGMAAGWPGLPGAWVVEGIRWLINLKRTTPATGTPMRCRLAGSATAVKFQKVPNAIRVLPY